MPAFAGHRAGARAHTRALPAARANAPGPHRPAAAEPAAGTGAGRKLKGPAAAALVAAAMLAAGTPDFAAEAARSGGRAGGRAFRAPPRASAQRGGQRGGMYGGMGGGMAPPVYSGYGYGAPMMGFSPFSLMFFPGGGFIFNIMVLLFVVNFVGNFLDGLGGPRDDEDDEDEFL